MEDEEEISVNKDRVAKEEVEIQTTEQIEPKASTDMSTATSQIMSDHSIKEIIEEAIIVVKSSETENKQAAAAEKSKKRVSVNNQVVEVDFVTSKTSGSFNLDEVDFKEVQFGDNEKEKIITKLREPSTDLFQSVEDKLKEIEQELCIDELLEGEAVEGEDEEKVLLVQDETEEVQEINRLYYYQKFNKLTKEINSAKLLNNYLNKKAAEFFKKRRMEHVFKDDDDISHSQEKYNRKLDALWELYKIERNSKELIQAELTLLRQERDEKLNQAQTLFEKMQKEERDATRGITFAKTGNPIQEKLVEKLLNRQRIQAKFLTNLRTAYFKLKVKMSKKTQQLHSLDDIGSHLHLIDYEKLKEDNRNHTEKMEERESELAKFRLRCCNFMQMMAHIREKSANLLMDRDVVLIRLEDVTIESNDCRERVNYFKKELLRYRQLTSKLKSKSDLLHEPKLLRDMEITLKKLETAKADLEQIRADYNTKCEQVENLRMNLEKEEKIQRTKDYMEENINKKGSPVGSSCFSSKKRKTNLPPTNKTMMRAPDLNSCVSSRMIEFKGIPFIKSFNFYKNKN